MRKKSDKINNETRKAQMEVQNREIAETLASYQKQNPGDERQGRGR